MNKDYLHLCRFWLEEDVVVGFVFYENLTDIHFVLRPGYEELADELITYANDTFPDYNDEKQLMFSEGQKELMEAAERKGYRLCYKDKSYVLDMTKTALDYELPEGFSFIDPEEVDPVKLARCTWDLTSGNWVPLKIGRIQMISVIGIRINLIMMYFAA